ncbi:MAG TPA: hypothetical protein GXZ47_10175 [Treponema sp.]|nr:hypothetical protein [Treponema sp.]
MKKLLGICALIAVVGVFFTACPLDPDEKLSAKERVEAFIDDANEENWSSLKAHTHPDAKKISQANAAFWENYFLDCDLTIGIINGYIIYFSDNLIHYTATLKEDEPDNYKILTIKKGSTVIFE